MATFKGILFVVVAFFFVLFLVLIAFLILLACVYLNSKDEALKKVSMEQKAINSAAIMRMVNEVIDSILNNKRELQLQMNVPFTILNLDKDAVTLAAQVKMSLNPELFTSKNEFMFTAEYLETYIVESLTTKMIEMYKTTNAEIARMQSL